MTLVLAMTAAVGTWAQTAGSGHTVADEGAWCWFADPRALHYENAAGTVNATYIGYIDVHGNVKATQYDFLTQRKTDVLVRSYFQPDDHNNPTFLVLPDERVMIFYTRHTDEACIWYRISTKPGDITALGEEKRLATANNTTYPSPFILSDDPQHIYLCWRGIGWHPTIARLTMPDADDNCHFDFGPKQIVQSTGARPYAKYQSNGRDKIYVAYTTGHPDNEQPNWLYMNVIDINHGNGPVLRDLNGRQLSVIQNGVFNVSKTDSYASNYAATIVDRTANIRNWVWQVVLDQNEHPVIAYPHIDDAKTTHTYWYARWNGTSWKNTWVCYAGHAFHQNWNQTERCYSGGMSIDPDNVNNLYLSIPTRNGQYNKDGVYEIWRYTINDEGSVTGSEQLTTGSPKNNSRPFVIPGSKNSPLRKAWMQGDYYYWMVQKNYPKGYPTALHCDYDWQEQLTREPDDVVVPTCLCFYPQQTLTLAYAMNTQKYEGTLLTIDGQQPLTYRLRGDDQYPELQIGDRVYRSQNRLLTSDDWATQSTGTSGDNHPTKVATWVLTLTYDGQTLTTYRNGLVDQVVQAEGLGGTFNVDGDLQDGGTVKPWNHSCLYMDMDYVCHSPLAVQACVARAKQEAQHNMAEAALRALTLPAETHTDLVLPTTMLGQTVTWTSTDEQVISSTGVMTQAATDRTVTLTAAVADKTRQFVVKALAHNVSANLRYALPAPLDMTANSATGFDTNTFGHAPEGLLEGLRSFTFLVKVRATASSKQPRLYDFGSGSGNSLFLRFNPLAAGIKLGGGATTMVSSATTLRTGQDYMIAVSYDAATHDTRIYVDGQLDASGTANQQEAYMLYEVAADTRNYIGRTQWWDGAYKNDNQDFIGTIAQLSLYDVCLSRREICQLQGLTYDEPQLPSALANPDFEGSYSPMQGSGVSGDRAIYVPEGWTADYATRNENDLTAMQDGDLYYSQFFAAKPQNTDGGKHTYWVRQRWGSSVLGFYQDLLLPAGSYRLDFDAYSSDAADKSYVYAGRTKKGVTAAGQWQTLDISFSSNGDDPTRIGFASTHADSDAERICAFDNFVLTSLTPSGITDVEAAQRQADNEIYDLSGRRLSAAPAKGLYIQQRTVRQAR